MKLFSAVILASALAVTQARQLRAADDIIVLPPVIYTDQPLPFTLPYPWGTTAAPTTKPATTKPVVTTAAPTTAAPTKPVVTTAAPTTAAPTTAAPTTAAPTTAAPTKPVETTAAPTTAAPTTAAPTTAAPTTAAPTTAAPTTAAPTTAAPTTAAPTKPVETTAAPTTAAPTPAPTTEAPTTPVQTTEAPTTAVVTEAPTTAVVTEAPTEAPTTPVETTAAPVLPYTFGTPTWLGSGCPEGTVAIVPSTDGQTVSVLFSEYRAETSGTTLRQRNACNLAVPVTIKPSISVGIIKVEYRGNVYVPDEVNYKAQFDAEYYWAGQKGPVVSKVFGPATDSDLYISNDVVATSIVWSACGASTNFRINSAVTAQKPANGTSLDEVQIAIDSIDTSVKYGFYYYLVTKDC